MTTDFATISIKPVCVALAALLSLAQPALATTVTEIIDATGDGAGNTLDRAFDVAIGPNGNVYVRSEARQPLHRRSSTAAPATKRLAQRRAIGPKGSPQMARNLLMDR